MRFELFCEKCLVFWSEYFKQIVEYKKTGVLRSTGQLLFPTMLIFTDCEESYVAELFGANKKFNPLIVKKNRGTSISRYINQFSDEPAKPFLILKNCQMALLDTLILGPALDLNRLNKRLKTSDLILSKLVGPADCDAALGFCENFKSLILNNIVAVNRFESAVRTKFIMNLVGVSRKTTPAELNLLLAKILPDKQSPQQNVYGIHTVSGEKSTSYVLAGQLQSIFLSTGMRETTIGEFIIQNIDILLLAFGAKSALYEKSFDWIEHDGSVQDTQINPDLLLEMSDGVWTIVDLKTAALSKRSITKGERKRRRFIDYVAEGCAQIANYRFYFSFGKNLEFARQKYGIQAISNVGILIVGNEENADEQENKEATRMMGDITIIDYDTLISMFLLSSTMV